MNYLTAPSTRRDPVGDGGLSELISDAWQFCLDETSADRHTDLYHLESIACGIYLTFEEGRTGPPFALASKADPEYDLADTIPGLHFVAVNRDEAFDRVMAAEQEFHGPIRDRINRLAATPGLSLLERAGAVVEEIFDQIARGYVLRAIVTDSTRGPALGPDIADQLPAAWAGLEAAHRRDRTALLAEALLEA